ncbi:sugar phosphate nucleotidyltransferase [Lacinutrix jangbogonensis]|uniref:sugar phosphate nucleotidyltransferase n=1 Tax=Lacinutrix jangbogonensis TaxID=1469557 RepID=UPI00053EE77C|nr:sugar phosphate nucleotidyltransferase [Lacinutrix jangbogonensis]
MIEKRTLAIMAAGLGSRFGSLKQLYSISSNNYSILDYSIFDAISVGFNTIVIIVSKQTLEIFKQRYTSKLPTDITIEFIVQESSILEKKYPERQKPFGTGQALLMLKTTVKNNFALINADDFYGRSAFTLMYNALFSNNNNQHYFIGYKLGNTLSKNGYVSRGECFLNKNNSLRTIIERTQIYKKDQDLFYKNADKSEIEIHEEAIVSMNFWGFTATIFDFAEAEFNLFLNNYGNNNTKEFYIATVVDASINKSTQQFTMLPTDSQWYGVTYEEDAIEVKKRVKKLTNENIYPELLW